MSNFKPPKYVKFKDSPYGQCCLELDYDKQQNTWFYYRAAGEWYTDFEIFSEGKILAIKPDYPAIHQKELIECTKEEWAECNGKYAT